MFGGNQGQEGSIFGWSYQASSLADRVIESYAGAHDWLSSFRYGAGGSLIEYTNFGESLYMLHSAIALVPATPFAIVTGVPTTAFVPALMRGD